MKKAELAFIIDDDNLYTNVLTKMVKVKKACHNIMVFENGAEALEYLDFALQDSSKVPDVILLDINMPIMDGFDFLDQYINLEHKLPKPVIIYMVTSSVSRKDKERAEQYSQVSQFIVKPITMDQIEKLFILPPEEEE